MSGLFSSILSKFICGPVERLTYKIKSPKSDCDAREKAILKLAKLGPDAHRAIATLIFVLRMDRFREGPDKKPIKGHLTYDKCLALWKQGLSDQLTELARDCKAAALSLPAIGLYSWIYVPDLLVILLRLAPFEEQRHRKAASESGMAQAWTDVYTGCLGTLMDAGLRSGKNGLKGDLSPAVPLLGELLKVSEWRTQVAATFLLRGAGPAAAKAAGELAAALSDNDAIVSFCAASALAIEHQSVPPTLNYEHPDPACPINVIHGQPRRLDHSTALILSHSRCGQAVAVVLGGPE